MDKNLFLLLNIIGNKGSVKVLSRNGLNFKKISNLLNDAIGQKLVIVTDESIELTPEGYSLWGELKEKHKRIVKDEWIDKEVNSIIPKLDIEFIFLPNQDDLNFD